MQDILTVVAAWRARGERVAIATVVRVQGSAPRAVGAKLAVCESGEMTGSVSGGCVEGAVLQESLKTIRSGQPKLLHYGIADDFAIDVGLACGGAIDVFVERLDW
ncbi:MAG: XdhC family protein [Chloroflexi bacterium]|nr:XdhC family protein [Chloroflexota bacterium]